MRISTRLRYGLLAIVEIGREFGEVPVKREENAQAARDAYEKLNTNGNGGER